MDAVSQCGEVETRKAIQTFTFVYRSVFNLCMYWKFLQGEIADQLGITEKPPDPLAKARIKLKEIILNKNKIHGE